MVVDDMGEGIGGRGLGGGKEAKSGCCWLMRNSGVSSSRVEVSRVCFKEEMVAVCEGMTPIGKLDLLLRSVLGKGQV